MVVLVLSNVQHFVIPWTLAHQAPLFMEFSRQEYCSMFPFHDSEIEITSLASTGLAGRFFTTVSPGKPIYHIYSIYINIHIHACIYLCVNKFLLCVYKFPLLYCLTQTFTLKIYLTNHYILYHISVWKHRIFIIYFFNHCMDFALIMYQRVFIS